MRTPCLFAAAFYLAACNNCPKGLERYYDAETKQYHCIDVAAKAKKQVDEEERQRAAERQQEEAAAASRRREAEAATKRQEAADQPLLDKLERNFQCRQRQLKGCDLEEMTADESREFVRWKARQRLRLRGRQGLTVFERELLQS